MKGNLRRDENAGVVGNAALSVASCFYCDYDGAFTANRLPLVQMWAKGLRMLRKSIQRHLLG